MFNVGDKVKVLGKKGRWRIEMILPNKIILVKRVKDPFTISVVRQENLIR